MVREERDPGGVEGLTVSVVSRTVSEEVTTGVSWCSSDAWAGRCIRPNPRCHCHNAYAIIKQRLDGSRGLWWFSAY